MRGTREFLNTSLQGIQMTSIHFYSFSIFDYLRITNYFLLIVSVYSFAELKLQKV